MPRPRIPARIVFTLLSVAALGLAACGGDTVDPVDNDPLAGLDELAIYAATVDRLGLLDPTAEANANLRQSVGWPVGPSVAGHFGNTLIYDPDVQSWITADEPAPADAVHVTWYQLAGPSVALPLSVQGHVTLTDRGGDASGSRVRVEVVNSATAGLADYELQVGATETAAARTERLRAQGFVGDGSRRLQLDLREDVSESLATGDKTSTNVLDLSEGAFSYAVTVDADSTVATSVSTVRFSGTMTVDGVTTRLELDMEERLTVPLSGTGTLTHAGSKIADITVTGNQMNLSFTRPDGRGFTAGQQSRLGTLVAVLLMPVLSVQTYFS